MENKIKSILQAKGLSQKELAKMTGMTEVGISKAIRGSASKSTIEKVASALNVKEDDIIDGSYIPVAKYDSGKTPLKLGAIELLCYVLEDGRRMFSGRGVQRALGVENHNGLWLSGFVGKGGFGR